MSAERGFGPFEGFFPIFPALLVAADFYSNIENLVLWARSEKIGCAVIFMPWNGGILEFWPALVRLSYKLEHMVQCLNALVNNDYLREAVWAREYWACPGATNVQIGAYGVIFKYIGK